MIVSFGDAATEDLYHGRTTSRVRRFPTTIGGAARRKLDMLNAAQKLSDLKAPPNNRLEALTGNLNGKHSIRVNDQWRLVFRWTANGAADVKLMDFH